MGVNQSLEEEHNSVCFTNNKQEVLEITNLPIFFTLFKNGICIKPAFAPT
jgi:hypothetical protein